MIKIHTIDDLTRFWSDIVSVLTTELVGGRRFASDPVGTLASYGFELGDGARYALIAALP